MQSIAGNICQLLAWNQCFSNHCLGKRNTPLRSPAALLWLRIRLHSILHWSLLSIGSSAFTCSTLLYVWHHPAWRLQLMPVNGPHVANPHALLLIFLNTCLIHPNATLGGTVSTYTKLSQDELSGSAKTKVNIYDPRACKTYCALYVDAFWQNNLSRWETNAETMEAHWHGIITCLIATLESVSQVFLTGQRWFSEGVKTMRLQWFEISDAWNNKCKRIN